MSATVKTIKPKANTPKIPRYLAIHEAGHVVGTWYIGQSCDVVKVQPPAIAKSGGKLTDRHGNEFDVNGFSQSSRYYLSPDYIDCILAAVNNDGQKNDVYRGIRRDIITCLAGPIAEIKFSKKNSIMPILFGGNQDYQNAWGFADRLPEGRNAIKFAHKAARKMIFKYWPTVLAVADELQARFELEDMEIESIIEATTGEGWRDYMCPMEWEYTPSVIDRKNDCEIF